MKILVTGSAGFIGSALCLRFLNCGYEVIGIDNHNDYYDQRLKEKRLERYLNDPNYTHVREDLENGEIISDIFSTFKPNRVVNLAAQAGVRYSIENPMAYVNSNIVGFLNILEACRHNKVEHLVYASSSSVYGANTAMPFSIRDNVSHPLSLYAASKLSNELMAHSYSHLFNLPTTGLRFFTVYGPWGRPDMALFKFVKSILEDKKIEIFNYGKHRRDFTYIDDIVEGLVRVTDKIAKPNKNWDGAVPDPGSSSAPWRIYNIGNSNPVDLMNYIGALENSLQKKAKKEFLPLQPGDVPDTFADVKDLFHDCGFTPQTTVEDGIEKFVKWYLEHYQE